MSIPKKKYRYMVEYIRRGKWTPVLHTDHEDTVTFGMVANAEEYQYRILLDGEDVTAQYKKAS